MTKSFLGWSAILILFVFGFSGCDDDSSMLSPDPGTLTAVAAADDRFETLVEALQRTGLDATLNDTDGNFTIFAPTDEAFATLGLDLSTLSDDALRDLLLYHLVSGERLSALDFRIGDNFVNTATDHGPEGTALTLLANKVGTAITINGTSSVVATNIIANNGVIHVVDEVLMPQSVVDFVVMAEGTNNLEILLGDTDLTEVLNGDDPLTVFAPVNAAFGAVPGFGNGLTTRQLRYILETHIVAGNVSSGDFSDTTIPTFNRVTSLRIASNRNVFRLAQNGRGEGVVDFIVTDIQATNGVIHLIDEVLAS